MYFTLKKLQERSGTTKIRTFDLSKYKTLSSNVLRLQIIQRILQSERNINENKNKDAPENKIFDPFQ